MKRFLALFAVVAIIGSMFAGVALAAAYEIELNNDEIVKGTGYVTVTGRILDTNAYTKDFTGKNVYVIYGNTAQKMDVVDGYKFEVLVDRTQVGNYSIAIDKNDTFVADGDKYIKANDDLTVDFSIIYDVTLDDELEFDFPVDDFVVISGNALDADECNVVLKYTAKYGNAVIGETTTNDDGDFVMAFNGDFVMDRAGDIEILIADDLNAAAWDDTKTNEQNADYVVHVDGDINAEEITVELSNTEFPVGLLDQTIELTIDDNDIDDDYFSVIGSIDTLKAGYYYTVTVEDDNDDAVTRLGSATETVLEDAVVTGWTLNNFNGVDVNNNGDYTDPGDTLQLEKDTYTVTVELFKENGVYDLLLYEGSTEFEVVNDNGYVLTGWHNFDEIAVGTKTMTLGGNMAVYKDGEAFTYYAVTVDGAGLTDDIYYNLNKAGVNVPSSLEDDGTLTVGNAFDLKPTHAGTIDVTIDVYEVDGTDYDLVKTYEEEIVVTGYTVEINLEEVLVDEEYELTMVVTDEDGNPVNNAYIYLLDSSTPAVETLFVDPADDNIIAGTYVDDEWDWDTVEELSLKVYEDSTKADVMTSLSDVIDVVGEAVLNVDADIDTLLYGNEEVVTITVTDDNGDPYFPVKSDVNIVEDGEVVSIGDKVDLDDDDVKEAFEVTIRVEEDADETIRLRVTDNNFEDQGEFEFNVVKPEVQLNSPAVLTENFQSEISFTIVDPRDGSVIEEPYKVAFDIDNEDCDNEGDFVAVWEDKDEDDLPGFDGATDVDVDEEYTYFLTASGIDWDAAEDEEVEPALVISVELFNDQDPANAYYKVDIAEIPFGEATLTATPEKMVMGTNNILTLTYADANGTALEDQDIDLDGDEIGTTDENGQVIYSAASVSTTGLTFEAETDAKDKAGNAVFVETTVKSTLDMEAPVITAPAEVAVPEVTVTVTDNVRVSAVRVNGNFLSIFPLATVTETVALEEGVNTIQVEAMDINNNATMQVLTVTYALPVAPTPDVELTVGTATEFGTPELTSGTTMVPVRFATKLGAAMDWDNATKTVTYTLGETVISMTSGSTTAIVNGENVELTQAPFINGQNFTMVPLRMIAQELGFQVIWTSNDAPIQIVK